MDPLISKHLLCVGLGLLHFLTTEPLFQGSHFEQLVSMVSRRSVAIIIVIIY